MYNSDLDDVRLKATGLYFKKSVTMLHEQRN